MKFNSSIKALTLILLVFVVLSTFASCSDENTTASGTNPTTAPTTASTTVPTASTTAPVDPNSPEGKAQAELNLVIDYLYNHFKSNDIWYPIEEDHTISVVKTPEGKYKCLYQDQDYPMALAYLFENVKSTWGLEGTFSYKGDDVVYTLADESGSATWQDIDAFDMDAYMESDEYKQLIANASKAALRAEINSLKRLLKVELVINNNQIDVNNEIYIYEDENGILCTNQGTIADALTILVSTNDTFSSITGSIFFMDGDTLMYSSQQYSEYSIPWYE